MAQFNVYVPDDLKRRIEAAKPERGLLSAIAREAWMRCLVTREVMELTQEEDDLG